ncbi:MAG: hypothetical protein KGH63_00395, partial [Candidatus Micrarchaeota archaeon]|nr:hypothetical protein [Candidatus Micrarchaeota archaeon]
KAQASLAFLAAFLVLLSILFILALSTRAFYFRFAQSARQAAGQQSLAADSLDLGLLSAAGPGLQTSLLPGGFTGQGHQLSIAASNALAFTTASIGLNQSTTTYEPLHAIPT